jgi:hypothetical protein
MRYAVVIVVVLLLIFLALLGYNSWEGGDSNEPTSTSEESTPVPGQYSGEEAGQEEVSSQPETEGYQETTLIDTGGQYVIE